MMQSRFRPQGPRVGPPFPTTLALRMPLGGVWPWAPAVELAEPSPIEGEGRWRRSPKQRLAAELLEEVRSEVTREKPWSLPAIQEQIVAAATIETKVATPEEPEDEPVLVLRPKEVRYGLKAGGRRDQGHERPGQGQED